MTSDRCPPVLGPWHATSLAVSGSGTACAQGGLGRTFRSLADTWLPSMRGGISSGPTLGRFQILRLQLAPAQWPARLEQAEFATSLLWPLLLPRPSGLQLWQPGSSLLHLPSGIAHLLRLPSCYCSQKGLGSLEPAARFSVIFSRWFQCRPSLQQMVSVQLQPTASALQQSWKLPVRVAHA